MLRTLAYALYAVLLLGTYALAAFSSPDVPQVEVVDRPTNPSQIRGARLEGLSRLDAASVARAPHPWHRLFYGPGATRPRRSPSSGGYYGHGGSYYGGGYRGYGGGGWFGGK